MGKGSTHMKQHEKVRSISIRRHLMTLFLGIMVPFLILAVYLVVNLIRLTDSYDSIVRNITNANSYSIEWKQNYDYVLYRMIVSSVNADDTEAMLDLQSPYDMADSVIKEYESLKKTTINAEDQVRVNDIMTLLSNLRKYTETIDQNITEGDKYDESIQMLDLDIRNLTELILENVQEYINSEAIEMENIREELQTSKDRAITLTFIALAASLLWAIFLMWDMNRNIVNPVTGLYRLTEKVAEGDFGARAENGGDAEIQRLIESFNSMTSQIGVLVENIRSEQVNLRKTELKLLQAQINPHFLYNTLDTIIWLNEAGEKKKVTDMVTSLSDFFRTTLSQGRDFVTIKEEELHIRSYLEIQKFRYADILDYEIDIPEELYGYTTLKLTMQPLVENALYHGIKYKRTRGLIKVTASGTEDNNILFTVTDDGIGMTAEELVKLRRLIDGEIDMPMNADDVSGDRGQGIGLRNVNERIRLNFGTGYGITASSIYGEGTTMQVLIPMRNMQNAAAGEKNEK